MAVSTANGGALENVSSLANCTAALPPAGYGLTNVFCVMSNRLNTPKVLYCPADFSKTALPSEAGAYIQNGPIATAATNWSGFGPGNLSYFVEGDAQDKYPKMILTGDRNIGNRGAVAGTVPATVMDVVNGPFGANAGSAVKSVLPPWEWTDPDLHQDVGNLGMADGSVQQSSLGGLNNALKDTKDSWQGLKGAGRGNFILNMP